MTPPQTKGVYPNWVNDKDIITQVLNEIRKQGGRLPYSYVINPEHDQPTQERMKNLLEKMIQEKLVVIPSGESRFLEADIEGSRAMAMGYRKYQRIKKWDGLRQSIGSISYILIFVLGLGIIGLVGYLIWHFIK